MPDPNHGKSVNTFLATALAGRSLAGDVFAADLTGHQQLVTAVRKYDTAVFIAVFKRSTGEDLGFVEENYKARSLIYRWKP